MKSRRIHRALARLERLAKSRLPVPGKEAWDRALAEAVAKGPPSPPGCGVLVVPAQEPWNVWLAKHSRAVTEVTK